MKEVSFIAISISHTYIQLTLSTRLAIIYYSLIEVK